MRYIILLDFNSFSNFKRTIFKSYIFNLDKYIYKYDGVSIIKFKYVSVLIIFFKDLFKSQTALRCHHRHF